MRLYSPLILASTWLIAPAALAQGDNRAPQDRPAAVARTPEYAFLDDVLGAKVSIQPGAEARREAAEDNDKAKRPSGEVKDLILECKSGNIEAAVVSFGGVLGIGDKTVALPATMLTWNPTNKGFDITATEDQLKALPAFDLKEARKRGLDSEVVVVRSTWTKLGHPEDATAKKEAVEKQVDKTLDKAKDKTKDKTDVAAAAHAQDTTKGNLVTGTTFVVVPGRYVVASEVDDHPVYALGEKFGKISKCVIDRNARTLAFCVVSHGGTLGIGDTEYLVPHRVMTLCRDGDNNIYCISRTSEQLKSGVKYEKPKQGGAVDFDAAKRAESMY